MASSSILMEILAPIKKVFALVGHRQTSKTTTLPNLKCAIVIVQSSSIYIAHGENGSLYSHYDFTGLSNHVQIVDCVYLYQRRCFLVALSDHSLVVVPFSCKDVKSCARTAWPHDIQEMFTPDGSLALVCSRTGYMAALSLSDSDAFPEDAIVKMAGSASTGNTNLITKDDGQLYYHCNDTTLMCGVITTANDVTDGTAPANTIRPGKKGPSRATNSKANINEDSTCTLKFCAVPIPPVVPNQCLQLVPASNTTGTGASGTKYITMKIPPDSKLISLVCHAQSNSASVILEDAVNHTTRWVKFARADGKELFSRNITNTPEEERAETKEKKAKKKSAKDVADAPAVQPLYCTESHGTLVLTYASSNTLILWSIRYGTLLQTIAIDKSPTPDTATSSNGALTGSRRSSNKNNCDAAWLVEYYNNVLLSASTTGTAAAPAAVSPNLFFTRSLSGGSTSNGPFRLFRRALSGDMTTTTTSGYTASMPSLCQNIGRLAPEDRIVDPGSSHGQQEQQLKKTSNATKRKFQELHAQFESLQETSIKTDLKDEIDVSRRQTRRYLSTIGRYYVAADGEETTAVDIDLDEVKALLLQLNEVDSASAVEEWEWNSLTQMAYSGLLSCSSNPSLLVRAAEAHRLDVLAAMVEHVSDLSEHQCVQILAHVMLMSNSAVNAVTVRSGRIFWKGADAAATNTTAAQVAKKRGRASKATPNNNNNNNNNNNSSSSDGSDAPNGEETTTASRLSLLRAMMESVLRRSCAYTSMLLSEAVQRLPLSLAVNLLRTVTYMLQGLCPLLHNDNNSSSNNGSSGNNSSSNSREEDEKATTRTAGSASAHSQESMMMPPRAISYSAASTVHLSAYVTDEQIQRAITWAEALLDAHFNALALKAVSHAGTRKALSGIMEAVHNADAAAATVEHTLGLWSHIDRVIHNGGQQIKPIAAVYQIEQLKLT